MKATTPKNACMVALAISASANAPACLADGPFSRHRLGKKEDDMKSKLRLLSRNREVLRILLFLAAFNIIAVFMSMYPSNAQAEDDHASRLDMNRLMRRNV